MTESGGVGAIGLIHLLDEVSSAPSLFEAGYTPFCFRRASIPYLNSVWRGDIQLKETIPI